MTGRLFAPCCNTAAILLQHCCSAAAKGLVGSKRHLCTAAAACSPLQALGEAIVHHKANIWLVDAHAWTAAAATVATAAAVVVAAAVAAAAMAAVAAAA